MGYSLQVAIFRATQQSERERAMCRKRLLESVKDPRQLIYIDETHESSNAARRRRAWSPKGIRPELVAYFEEDFKKRYTLIGACDIQGFVIDACEIVERENGKDDKDKQRGTVDMDRFERHVEERLVPVLGRYEFCEPRSIVVMDNATTHISERVQELIAAAGALLICTAPYSPDLNPIEYFFSVYKAGLKRHSYRGGANWMEAHYLSLQDVTEEKARNTFAHCEVPGCSRVQVVSNDAEDEDDFILGAVVALVGVWHVRRP